MVKKLYFRSLIKDFFTLLVMSAMLIAFSNGLGAKDKKQVKCDLTRIIKAGQLVVGTSADYPPYEFHLFNDKEQEIVGLDIDIAKEIAKKLGVKLKIKNVIFSKLLKSLKAGDVDIAIAGISPTEKRKKVADFSEIYFQAIQNMLIRVKDSVKIKSIQDLRGLKVGTQRNSIQSDMVRHQIVGAYFLERETIRELIEDLKTGKIDALILEEPVAKYYSKKNREFLSLECNDDMLGSAIAVRKGSKKLKTRINAILKELKKKNMVNQFAEDAVILMNK